MARLSRAMRPLRTSRRMHQSSSAASSVTDADQGDQTANKMAPVCQSCDHQHHRQHCYGTEHGGQHATAATVGMSRRNARTSGVAASATSGRNGKPSSSTRPVAKAFRAGNQPAAGERRREQTAHRPRQRRLRREGEQTSSTQAIQRQHEELPTKCISVCR